MGKFVGFDRRIQLDWLDTTAALVQAGLPLDEISERLNRYLVDKVVGDEARAKTILVLFRVWANVRDEHKHLRDEGLQLAAQTHSEERLWIHWAMSLLTYPVFRDVAATVGRLSRLQGVISNDQVQRRIVEHWGQRTTVQRATRRLIRTFVDWSVLKDTGKRGHYEANPPNRTANQDLALWFLTCALQANEAEQIPMGELSQLPYLFPFDLLPFTNHVRQSERFEVTRQGLDLEMVAARLPIV
jgi:hypothetical protein